MFFIICGGFNFSIEYSTKEVYWLSETWFGLIGMSLPNADKIKQVERPTTLKTVNVVKTTKTLKCLMYFFMKGIDSLGDNLPVDISRTNP